MIPVAIAQRHAAIDHLVGRNADKRLDGLVKPAPRLLGTGIEPVSAREMHERADIGAAIGPLADAEAPAYGHEQPDRRVEESEIPLVLVEPSFRVAPLDFKRGV